MLNSSFKNIGISLIKFHSIPKHQSLSVAKKQLEKTVKVFELNLAHVYSVSNTELKA